MRGDTIVACATAGLPIVRLRTGSSSGTSSDLPSGTLTLVDSRISPTQFGPRSGTAAAAAAAPAAGAGAMLIVICIGARPSAIGAAAVPFAIAAFSTASWAAAAKTVKSPAQHAAASAAPRTARERAGVGRKSCGLVSISCGPPVPGAARRV
ncbi:Uncharacterised protein [Burkholderia pseudomallei]|nr:hypothetical protein [Burkholderia pseudomallei]KGW32303.1 hypothetical protein Y045_2072 [Burkholderia pseudomallei MSHR2451]KGW37472.1 hypothetical protein Y602_6084 [Burkholderia pseudomallei MSHR733]KGW37896.1 hypothetical protein Y047_5949 [Burkholderia pseudomallei MSHR3016]KGW97695.1 hypothetical protein Y048_6080 [Burkholderia pseudomallei MSHR456]KGX43785.1 hypothetical protein Y043_4607 [Burkholderia pseudomallei MSHR2138]